MRLAQLKQRQISTTLTSHSAYARCLGTLGLEHTSRGNNGQLLQNGSNDMSLDLQSTTITRFTPVLIIGLFNPSGVGPSNMFKCWALSSAASISATTATWRTAGYFTESLHLSRLLALALLLSDTLASR